MKKRAEAYPYQKKRYKTFGGILGVPFLTGLLFLLGGLTIGAQSPPTVPLAIPVAPSNLQVGGFPGGQMRLAWQDNAGDEIGYRIERSIHTTATHTLLVTLPANTTLYTDTTVALDTTYWYRVQAYNNDGASDYSNESYNVSFAAGSVPNDDERYLLVLINEARADPTAYGYPSIAPVPLVAYNPLLNYAAHSHSQAILNSDFSIGHCDPAGRCPSERARDVGYEGGVSENLIAGGDGPTAVEGAHQSFMDSEGHRNNLLDPNAKEAGLGHAFDAYETEGWPGQYTETFCGTQPVAIPALPSGVVVPYWGNEETVFTFLVNFYSADGYSPTRAQVVIDGTARDMTLRHGTAANGSYQFTTMLGMGSHQYYFDFAYGPGLTARLPESGSYDGPDVNVGRAVREVPSEYNTIRAALNSAPVDTTVMLAAGTFTQTESLWVPPGVDLVGSGMDRTTIRGSSSHHVLIVPGASLIEGMTITGSGGGYFESGIWNEGGQPVVRNCRLSGNNVGFFSWCFTENCGVLATVQNCIIEDNARAGVDANQPAVHHLINNTVVNNGRGLVMSNSASLVENNIVACNTGDGLAGNDTGPTARYNDVWDNGNDYSGLSPGEGSIGAAPLFLDEAGGDYHLADGSPARDAGNPDASYDDPDGTRNDMGAFGGPWSLFWPTSQASAPARLVDTTSFTVTWSGMARGGVTNYDVQYRVGASGAWTDWLTHTTATSAVFGPAQPVSVTVGTTCYFQSRARDAWGREEDYPGGDGDVWVRVVSQVFEVYLPLVVKASP